MAAASKPEKAPDNEAEAKKVATLLRRSSRGMKKVACYTPQLQSLARIKPREVENKTREKATWADDEWKILWFDNDQTFYQSQEESTSKEPRIIMDKAYR